MHYFSPRKLDRIIPLERALAPDPLKRTGAGETYPIRRTPWSMLFTRWAQYGTVKLHKLSRYVNPCTPEFSPARQVVRGRQKSFPSPDRGAG